MRYAHSLAAAATLTATLLGCGSARAQSERVVIVHAGTLIDVPGQPPKPRHSVIVRGERIAAIQPGFVREKGAEIVDLREAVVVPGLIDSHVHILSEYNRNIRLDRVRRSEADHALNGAHYARKTLEAGFTTIRDVGAPQGDAIFALRDAIREGRVPGPRLYASGRTIAATGGHGDIHGYRADVLETLASEATCDGPAACRRAVRLQIKRGADHIKITATGGVLSETAAGTEQQFFDDELQAIVETAHALGRKVTAHAHGKQGIEAALRAGVDSIEHGTYLDDATIALFKKTGAYLVPTVLAGNTVEGWAKDETFLPPPVRVKAAAVGPQMRGMLRRAHRGGVKIAFGTDSGVSAHGDNGQEFLLMVAAGMTPEQALTAATVTAAEHLGLADQVGSIQAGKFADLIAVQKDPRSDVSQLTQVFFVMKGGVIYKRR